MPGLLRRLHFVRSLPRRSGDAALIAALGVCGAAEADVIAAELMERDASRASLRLVTAVLRAWPRLGAAAREAAALSAGDRLEGIVDSLSSAGDGSSKRTAAMIEAWRVAHGSAGVRSIQRLGTLGVLTMRGVGDTARAALGELTMTAATLPEAERAALDGAVAHVASAALDHGDSGFMACVAQLAESPGPALSAWLNTHGDAGHGMVRSAARRMLTRAADPIGLACAWLRHVALARPAAVFIEEMFAGGRGDLVVVRVDLLRDEAARGALRKWCRAERLTPSLSVMGGWSTEARARVAEWLDVIGLREEKRTHALEELLLDRAAGVRMAAVVALSRLKASPRADEALFKAARDEDERVAVAAIEVLGGAQSARRRSAIAPVLEELAKRGGGGVRAAAAGVLTRYAADEGSSAPEVRVRAQAGSVRR